MNEKIDEIIKECTIVHTEDGLRATHFDEKRFAEVLLRKAAIIAERAQHNKELSSNAIKQYFGLK